MPQKALDMLPSLHHLRTDGKRKRSLLPCHGELRYEDGESLNRNRDQRVQGGSSKFSRYEQLPFGTTLTTTEQIRALSSRTQTSWEVVMRELYSDRTSPPTTPSADQRADQAFVKRFDNQAKPQFYLLTVQREATLSHIQPDGVFWSPVPDTPPDPTVGDLCYTNGFVWTNANPRWAWKSEAGERIIRVRITIPAGTQVVIDRAPVYGGVPCQFDEQRESLFPDVLLGPAEFRVEEVVRYRRTGEYYSDSAGPPERFKYLEPRERGVAESDLDYAQLRVFDNDEFVDVKVIMLRQVKVPDANGFRFS